MIQLFFPFIIQLHIFQLDEYDLKKFLQWVFSHFFVRRLENKKKFIFTPKAKGILLLSILLVLFEITILTLWIHWIGFILGLLLATQPYIFLTLASVLLIPYERYKKKSIKTSVEEKLKSFSHVKVIGITGSYGKTSVKEFLYDILKTKYKVLRTPGSYNTPLGIAKVVNLELDNTYDFFICEIGAYRRGEIKEICDMTSPTYGILTGINEQHIETFGSLENTTKGKFELITSLPKDGLAAMNGDNNLIRSHLEKILNKVQDNREIDSGQAFRPRVQAEAFRQKFQAEARMTTYGYSDKKFSIHDSQQSSEGTSFTLVLNGKKYKANTQLLGKSNLQNILGAATMSFLLGMKPEEIIKAIAKIQPVAHRLEIKEMGNMTIIDDAYNSNVDGFQEAIALLESFDKPKVFVTPGIVDLGKRTLSIHENLGKLLNGIDHIILIGESDRTKGLENGIKDKKKITKLISIKEIWAKIAELNLKNPVVVLENDLPDNY